MANTFETNIEALDIGMTASNYDRYKLISLYKKEIGTSPKRGTSVEDIVLAILKHRQKNFSF